MLHVVSRSLPTQPLDLMPPHCSRLRQRRIHLSRNIRQFETASLLLQTHLLRRYHMGLQEQMQIDHAAQRIGFLAELINSRLGVATSETLMNHAGDRAALYSLGTKFMEDASTVWVPCLGMTGLRGSVTTLRIRDKDLVKTNMMADMKATTSAHIQRIDFHDRLRRE